MSDFPFQRVVVTGGAGFLGSHVVEKLKARGVVPYVPRSAYTDLRKPDDVADMFHTHDPQLVIHCAAICGGIGLNQAQPATLFHDNLRMGSQILHLAHLWATKKMVNIGTICSYPENTPVPFREEDLWNGYPEPTNAAYGMAKKMLIVQSQAYRQQYGFNSINLLLANLYGPGDNFDPETSHVIPAIIRKCVEAVETGAQSITLWGTGQPTREFLHVEDAADAILLAAEHYDSSDPVNVGTGVEISIEELACLIASQCGYRGVIQWDHSKPDGQMRRCLNVSKASTRFSFYATRWLGAGLRETIEWYKSTRPQAILA